MPHLGLAAATSGLFEFRREGIVGMNLNRQEVVGKKKLHQQGKFRIDTETSASPFYRHKSPTVSQGFSREWAACDPRIEGSEPCFAECFRQIRLIGKQRC